MRSEGEARLGEVFISYKQEERERMRPLADGLRALGVDVWFDERLSPDRSFAEEITERIKTCRAQLVCWSPAAITSQWVLGEADIGRRRGVLVAAMLEPCELPPPFNMLHAENLAAWSGDARHPGWRKIVEAVGRKIARPGLGELAALQASEDTAAWKSWARKYPNDLQADAAWAKAEELDIAAARARTASERQAAQRAAEEAERGRAARAVAPPVAPEPAPARKAGLNPFAIGVGAGVLGAVGAAAFFIVTQQQRTDAAPVETVAAEEPALAHAADALAAEPEQRAALEPPPAQAARVDPTPALAALDRISAHEWSAAPARDLLARAIAQSSKAALDAAARADARAQVLVGTGYAENVAGYPRNYAEAARVFRLAANQGNAVAQMSLGRMNFYGQGAEFDQQEALRLFRLSANQGQAGAQNLLGVMYENGAVVERDYTEAARLFRLAANQGQRSAQYNLGSMYRGGRGVAKDDAEAARLFRLAADQGVADAQYHLGYMYMNAQGVSEDRAEGVRLWRLAARQEGRAEGSLAARGALRRLGEDW